MNEKLLFYKWIFSTKIHNVFCILKNVYQNVSHFCITIENLSDKGEMRSNLDFNYYVKYFRPYFKM